MTSGTFGRRGEGGEGGLERVHLLPVGLLLGGGRCRVGAVVGVVLGVPDTGAELVQQGQFRQFGIDETGLDEVDQFLVRDSEPSGEGLCGVQVDALAGVGVDRLSGRLGGARVAVQRPPFLERRGVGEDRRLGGGEAQVLDERVRPVVGLYFVEKLVAVPEDLHNLGQRSAEADAEHADGLDPQVERQRAGVPLGEQLGVCQLDQVLWFGEQLFRGRSAGVTRGVLGQLPVRDVVLQDLVDDVNVRQRGQRVLAGELDREQVRAALLEHIDRLGEPVGVVQARVPDLPAVQEVRPLRLVRIDELQDVDEVGGRTQNRPAVRAFDVINRPEQPLHGREVLEQARLGGQRDRRARSGDRQPGLRLQASSPRRTRCR